MAEEKFSDNLLRAISAELHIVAGLMAAREMFGKSYFALGAVEKATVDQTVVGMLVSNYQALTREFLAAPTTQGPVGFRFPSASTTSEKS